MAAARDVRHSHGRTYECQTRCVGVFISAFLAIPCIFLGMRGDVLHVRSHHRVERSSAGESPTQVSELTLSLVSDVQHWQPYVQHDRYDFV